MESYRQVFGEGGGEMKNNITKRRERKIMRDEDDHKEKGDINSQADAFIKNFRKQLRIQREESFKRYQEMIARGV
ncbi:hypothetical protein Pint_31364 [Pistacia integerrima]|uniref:Uncharacterized protein n=1 Tax=Pistacia integerrima TaxID=434235 RepID=A0ACC0XTJ5_9ROSI|nr:hypothetical protein Pint_31364 [Pistacia integerrima]